MKTQNTQKPKTITPRPYQIDLYRQALRSNTIAFLDTGAGKTLVSILLLLHFVPCDISSISEEEEEEDLDIHGDYEERGWERCRAVQKRIDALKVRKYIFIQSTINTTNTTHTNTTHLNNDNNNNLEKELEEITHSLRVLEDQLRTLLKPLRRRRVVFLAPTVPLVRQHADLIGDITDLRVGRFTSSDSSFSNINNNSNSNNSSSSYSGSNSNGSYGSGLIGGDIYKSPLAFHKHTSPLHVMVMTPQILLNLLRHGIMNLELDVSLVVFDECHHAGGGGGSAYTCVLKEFYWPLRERELERERKFERKFEREQKFNSEDKQRHKRHFESEEEDNSDSEGILVPRIFGMTASPVNVFSPSPSSNNPNSTSPSPSGNTMTSIMNQLEVLQRSMDAVLVTVRDRKGRGLDGCVVKARECIVEYDNLRYSVFAECGVDDFNLRPLNSPTSHNSNSDNVGLADSMGVGVYTHHLARLVKMHNKSLTAETASKILRLIHIVVEVVREMGVWSAALLAREYADTVYRGVRETFMANSEGRGDRAGRLLSEPGVRSHLSFGVVYDTVPPLAKHDFTTVSTSSASSNNTNTNNKNGGGARRLDVEYEESTDFVHPFLDTSVPPHPHELSDKLRRLCSILCDISSSYSSHSNASKSKTPTSSSVSEYRTIIFVKKRATAKILCDFITYFAATHFPGVKPAYMTGFNSHTLSKLTSSDLTSADRRRAFHDFHKGAVNTLIVTSVAEEGLDVPACNMVVIFDLFRTPTAYVQSRGRARSLNSEYIVFVEAGNRDQLKNIAQARVVDKMVRKLVSSSDSTQGDRVLLDRSETVNDDMEVDYLLGEDEDDDPMYIETTGAVISKVASVNILQKYVSALPRSAACNTGGVIEHSTEMLSGGWGHRCTISLPMPMSMDIELIEGPVRLTSKMAYQSACLKACKYLHETGALNDHLVGEYSKAVKKAQKRSSDGRPKVDSSSSSLAADLTKMDVLETEDKLIKVPTLVPKVLLYSDKWRQIYPDFDKAVEVWQLMEWNRIGRGQSLAEFLDKQPRLIQPAVPKVALYSMSIEIECSKYGFVLLNTEPWPAIPTFSLFIEEESTNVSFHPHGLVEMSPMQWVICRDFHLRMFGTIMKKQSDKIPSSAEGERDKGAADESLLPENMRMFKMLPSRIINGQMGIDWKLASDIVHYDAVKYGYIHIDKSPDFYVGKLVTSVHNGLNYQVVGVRSDMNAHSPLGDNQDLTFLKYYATNHKLQIKDTESPLLSAKHLPAFKNHLHPLPDTQIEAIKNRRTSAPPQQEVHNSMHLIPEICRFLPFDIHYVKLVCLLPSILFKLEEFLCAAELQEIMGLQKVPLSIIYTAVSAPVMNPINNYDRLETLGDSFLKYAVSTYLYAQYSGAGEGSLTTRRGAVVSNRYLYEQAMTMDIAKYLNTTPFYPRQWAPPEVKPFRPKRKSDPNESERGLFKTVSLKMIADFTEALIGAAFIGGGFQLAFETVKTFGCIKTCSFRHIPPPMEEFSVDPQIRTRFEILQTKLGYSFRNKILLYQAFTHPSFKNVSWGNYQRLEFLGDAVLDMLVVRYFFVKYQDVGPGVLSELRQSAVCNGSFGRIAIESDLHKFLTFHSANLQDEISQFLSWYYSGNNMNESAYDIEEEGPKALGDTFEALVGAIYEDLEYDAEKTWIIIRPMCLSFMEKFCRPEVLNQHPVRKLYDLVHKKGYGMENLTMKVNESSNTDKYKCCIYFKNAVVGESSGNSKNAVKRNASNKAIEYFDKKPDKRRTMIEPL